MKRFTMIALAVMSCVLLVPRTTLAAGDTLVVYATQGDGILDKIVMADTAADGTLAHKVYKLVSTDTTYIYDGPITINNSVTFIGVPGANGKLPTIQPDVLSDQTIPANLFIVSKKDTKVTFKNLYLLGLSIVPEGGVSSANTAGIAIQASADNIKVYADNLVFDYWLAFGFGYNGNWDSFFITNCIFRNFVHPNQWYVGEVLRNSVGSVYTDSIVFRNNTMTAINGYAAAPVTKYYTRYFEFTHNTVAYTFKNPFFIFNVTNAKINNNIFYNNYVGGVSFTENPWWDNLFSPDETYGVLALQNLSLDNAKMFQPNDSTNAKIDSIAEARRTVEVKNNICYWSQSVTTLWQNWNDTATWSAAGMKILTPSWMNDPTKAMFADKAHWPGLSESGNITNQDPGYGSVITGVMNQSATTGIGLAKWFAQARSGSLANDVWGAALTTVGSAANWVPAWPVSEAASLKYSNNLTAPDGKPYGDPRWFNAGYGPTGVQAANQIVPEKFALSQNYPNPFNPSTTFQYTLTTTGLVKFTVYNILGQAVKTVVNKIQSAGAYEVRVDMSNQTSGIYFGVLEQGTSRQVQKMVLMK
ncbi:MAG: T9SS type A sorting domain-containing protein [Bacteroidetes bacterium]|nr:T9SS type A sorting domain-containing protein [Bacteroidota bacterium]